MTLHIHLYASPGMGKSTIALNLTATLKKLGVNAEMVPEYAKELVNTNSLDPSKQMLTSMEQLRREWTLDGTVDVLVAESPPLLGVPYAPLSYQAALCHCLHVATADWDHLSYLVERDLIATKSPYVQAGRIENPKQSMALQEQIQLLLNKLGIDYTKLTMANRPSEIDRVVSVIATDVFERMSLSEAVHSGTNIAIS